jgi:surface antigen
VRTISTFLQEQLMSNTHVTRGRANLSAAAAAAVLSVCVAVCAVGQNLGFLKDSPAYYLDADDVKLQRAAAAAVLETGDAGAYRDWHNAASGSSGKVTVLSSFNTQDGRECRKLRYDMHTTKGGDGAYTLSACRAAGEPWKVNSDARQVQPR